jgi:hypothetical protein
VVAQRWRNVVFDQGVLSIERGMVFGPDGLVETHTKTHAVRWPVDSDTATRRPR